LISDSLIFADAFMPPDEMLNSTLGKSKGDVYNHIF